MATTNLSQNRATQRLLKHRAAVATLARQAAIKAVKRQLQAQGVKLYSLSAKDIRVLADDYLAQHRAKLVADAAHLIATAPGFARWRLPPGHEVFVKSTITNTLRKGAAKTKEKFPMTDAAPTIGNRTLRRLPNAAYRQSVGQRWEAALA